MDIAWFLFRVIFVQISTLFVPLNLLSQVNTGLLISASEIKSPVNLITDLRDAELNSTELIFRLRTPSTL